MASFLAQASEELLAEESGALAVVARGLGASEVLLRLVQRHAAPSHLVFLLNVGKDDERQLLHSLAMAGEVVPSVITNECESNERAELYLLGGVLIVTSRILIVDLLAERVPVEQVSGVLVANAHRVSETSNVAFILRIIKQRNKQAFVKALSDDALALTNGEA